MVDHDSWSASTSTAAGGLARELAQQLGREAVRSGRRGARTPARRPAGRRGRAGTPAGTCPSLAARVAGFGGGNRSRIDLEHDVEPGQREHDHHEARASPRAGSKRSSVVRRCAQQVAVQLGLAVLVEPERDVQLGERASRGMSWRGTRPARAGGSASTWKYERVKLNSTLRSCSPSSAASATTPSAGVQERERERERMLARHRRRPTRYAPLRRKNGDRTISARTVAPAATAQQAQSSGRSAPPPGARRSARSRYGASNQRSRSTASITPARSPPAYVRVMLSARPRRRLVEVRVDELDARVDADRREHAARDRVEERLGQLAVAARGDERRVLLGARRSTGPGRSSDRPAICGPRARRRRRPARTAPGARPRRRRRPASRGGGTGPARGA